MNQPIPQEIREEALAMGNRYKTPTGGIKWALAKAENPDVFERLSDNGRRSLKDIMGIYYSTARKLAPSVAAGTLRAFTQEEIAAIMELGRRYKGAGGSVQWGKSKQDPQMLDLLTRHHWTAITSRFHYEDKKHHYKRQKSAGKRQSVSGITNKTHKNLWPEEQNLNARLPASVVQQVRQLSVAPTPTPAVEPKLCFCPFCGENIARFNG